MLTFPVSNCIMNKNYAACEKNKLGHIYEILPPTPKINEYDFQHG